MANIYVSSVDGSDADNGSTWALAKATLTGALAIATNADTIWLDPSHAESTAGAVTLTCPSSQGLRILCADARTSEPPTGLATSASVAVGAAAAALTVGGFAYIYGVNFRGGTNNSSTCVVSVLTPATPGGMVLDNCVLDVRTANAGGRLDLGQNNNSANDNTYVSLLNCIVKFGATGQTISLRQGDIEIRGLSLDGAGSIPTTLFSFAAGIQSNVIVEASDLSGRAFTNLVNVAAAAASSLLIRNCKIPASMVVTTGTHPGIGGPVVRMHNCDDGSTNYRIAEASWAGSVVSDTSVYNDAGADDGSGQGFSWKMTTNANALFPFALLESPEFVQWNTATGSSKTVTVEIVHDGASAFKDNEVWLEVQYLSATGTPLGAIVTDRMANVLSTATAQATSTATWTGDTGTGPNGSTTWNTLKLECSFTPQKAGYIHAKVVMAVPSKTVYVDPLITVS